MRFDLLDPKSDYVFKRLFADAPQLLVSLSNAVRADRPPAEVVRMRNPLILPSGIEGSVLALDVLATDACGRRFDVEVRVHRRRGDLGREQPQMVRMAMLQLAAAAEPVFPPATVGIQLLDFDIFDDPDRASACFEMRSEQDPRVLLGDGMELRIVELRKAASLGESLEACAGWATFFEHWSDAAKMARIEDPAIRAARDKLIELSLDDHECRRAAIREFSARRAGMA